jgi:hypothetical protein
MTREMCAFCGRDVTWFRVEADGNVYCQASCARRGTHANGHALSTAGALCDGAKDALAAARRRIMDHCTRQLEHNETIGGRALCTQAAALEQLEAHVNMRHDQAFSEERPMRATPNASNALLSFATRVGRLCDLALERLQVAPDADAVAAAIGEIVEIKALADAILH